MGTSASIQSTSLFEGIDKPFLETKRDKSKLAVLAKFLVVAIIVAALTITTYFGVIGLLALVFGGASDWQIGLVGIGAALSVTALFGSLFFASKYRMLDDTGHNLKDTKYFLLDTLI